MNVCVSMVEGSGHAPTGFGQSLHMKTIWSVWQDIEHYRGRRQMFSSRFLACSYGALMRSLAFHVAVMFLASVRRVCFDFFCGVPCSWFYYCTVAPILANLCFFLLVAGSSHGMAGRAQILKMSPGYPNLYRSTRGVHAEYTQSTREEGHLFCRPWGARLPAPGTKSPLAGLLQ